MLKKVVSCVLIVTVLSGIPFAGYATTIMGREQVLDAQLLDAYMESGNADEKQPVMVWISDIDSTIRTIDLNQEAVLLSSVNEGIMTSATDTLSENVSLDDYRNFLRNSASELDKDVAKRLLSEYRSICAETYLAHNTAFVDANLPDYEITYVSHYSPIIFLNLKQNEAYTLARNPNVQKLSLNLLTTIESDDIVSSTIESSNELRSTPADYPPAAAFEYVKDYNDELLDITRVNGGYSDLGLTGENIIVGTVDFYGVALKYESVLGLDVDHNDWESGHSDGSFTHSTDVAAIIRQIAPGCELYCASAQMRGGGNEAVEWLIDQGVNILSLSYSRHQLTASSYDSDAQWLDCVCNSTLVTAVSAVGNNGKFSDWGMGYNVITVGNVQKNGVLNSSSSYNSMSVSGVSYKPDICAPGSDVMSLSYRQPVSGTSYATPIVASICALMMECNSTLTYCPDLVKSVMTAAVNNSYTDDQGNVYTFLRNTPVSSSTNYEKYGAGIIDCEKALLVLRNNYFKYGVVAANQKPIDEYSVRMSSGRTYRISMSFMRPSTGSINTNNLAICNLPDLDLKIYDPNGNQVAYSTTSKNNIEIVEFTTSVSGTYTIAVNTFTASNANVYYSVAWLIYS